MQERRPDPALSDDSEVRSAWLRALAIAAIVLVIDQVTKTWAQQSFFDEPMHVIGPLSFTLLYNSGVAFGIGSGVLPLVLATVVLAAVVFLLGRNITVNKPTVVGAGLVIGGALGNLGDRLFRGKGGAVVDFIDVGWWPVFNVADMAVVGGAVLLAIWGTRRKAET